MPEYINPNHFTVQLTGSDGKSIKLAAKQRAVLPEYFERYQALGYIKRVDGAAVNSKPALVKRAGRVQGQIQPAAQRRAAHNITPPQPQAQQRQKRVEVIKEPVPKTIDNPPRRIIVRRAANNRANVVGRAAQVDPGKLLNQNLVGSYYPISNGVGIGILSFNRVGSLRRLVESIKCYTDLRRTTVFISDDASTDPATVAYLEELKASKKFVVLLNRERLGVAGNSNRLLRCLKRFKHGLLLNDDVEVLASGWDTFYPMMFGRTGLHHFCRYQPGIYGANAGQLTLVNGLQLIKVTSKPHGTVLAFTATALDKAGYFDEQFGLYGMEHIDWSGRMAAVGLQPAGYYDVPDSKHFFMMHPDKSAVADRSVLLTKAKQLYEALDHNRGYVAPSARSAVPQISFVVPYRDYHRSGSVLSVLNNIRGQLFPDIKIILVEHDSASKVDRVAAAPAEFGLVNCPGGKEFNKSKAFNAGVAMVQSDYVVLHDADMLVKANYAQDVADLLHTAESCHLGKTVLYLNKESTNAANATGVIDGKMSFDRTVGYFEGGSLACRTKIFWSVGGFNEEFWGYGVEDCEFYERLSGFSNWREARTHDFLHLWHDRVPGWQECHERNKALGNHLRAKTPTQRLTDQRGYLATIGYGKQLAAALGKHG